MTFTITQNDTAPAIKSRLTDGGEPVNLTNVNNIHFYVEDQFQRMVISDDLTGRVNLLDQTAGEVSYVFAPEDTEDTGSYKGEWEVEYGNGTIETFPTNGKVEIEVVEEIN